MKEKITCPACHIQFAYNTLANTPAQYCPFCKSSLHPTDQSSSMTHQESFETPSMAFLPEHIPKAEHIQFSLENHHIIKSIGKGGMGEVFLAYDTICGRKLALKQIRPDLLKHEQMHRRFLKEAHLTSQLTHPAIIPIYSIHSEPDSAFYTMPFVEGETLKQLLKRASRQETSGKKMDHLAESIPALIRIFLSICQAVAYAHSKEVLHRDLKPENIIVGQYGQIIILDWGLAKIIKSKDFENIQEKRPAVSHSLHHLTHLGKVVGTVAYMAPEMALGHPANFQTDIYSLGVILYQVLTLKLPFYRHSLKKFREKMHLEKIMDPAEIAPYRDVPRSLSRVVMKCLASNPDQRYQTVDELVHDLENYIEGRAEWFQIAELNIQNKADWEFQEHVFVAEHIAPTRETELSDWVNLMISKDSFQGNIKLEASIKIGEEGHGIGFLLSIPEAAERQHLNDGYCLWVGAELSKSTKLLRSTVEVVHAPDVFLRRKELESIRIEKIDNNIHFFLNDALQFSYISHLPLSGTHVGLVSRDADFIIKNFNVFVGSQNVTVNCLAVPDAFLAHKDYITALNEYRRIGYSFPGRAEGREAMFRAGITLLEQANNRANKTEKIQIYDLALEEFHKLYGTPGAPLEYLGKALVYQALGDYIEEAKCFELGFRRYPKHPLLPVLQEQIVYRMHDSSRYDRQATFNFLLIVIRYLPHIAAHKNTWKLLNSLEKYWEQLFFIEPEKTELESQLQMQIFGVKLAFWLGLPYVLSEIIDYLSQKSPLPVITIENALFCLLELGSWKLAKMQLQNLLNQFTPAELKIFGFHPELIDTGISVRDISLESAINSYLTLYDPLVEKQKERLLLYLMEAAVDAEKTEYVHQLFHESKTASLSPTGQLHCNANEIWALLLDKEWKQAGELLHSYSLELLSQESSILHFLYGCWLYVTEGKDIAFIHFSGVFEVPYPRTWTLFSYYLKGKIRENQGWMLKSFLWERRQLFRQLALFYSCIGEEYTSLKYRKQALETSIDL